LFRFKKSTCLELAVMRSGFDPLGSTNIINNLGPLVR
jgi:hypothetical protein